MDRERSVCPLCGQPVETIVGRHKTLGAWVPVWGRGPCRNPDCPAHGEAAAPPTEPATPSAEPAAPAARRQPEEPAGK
ncbi:hypothetical protein [Streptomyces sp. NPDC048521]|uniref:hypothetical protein n=1 Tax=Streptomyces sp. NPDC048521 TaxID=3365566 RepID=UPI00371BA470